VLKADKGNGQGSGRIVIDSIPPEAWDYRLGNRSALEWVLDQYNEKKPKDPTIREKFDTYRFAEHKEKVIDFLARVAAVSVAAVRIEAAMKTGSR
jgi:predicted helicase